MGSTKVVTKSLAGAEDLLRGVDTVVQNRAGTIITMHNVHVPVAVSTDVKLAELDPEVATYASIVTDTDSVFYKYSSTDLTGIVSNYGGSWILDNLNTSVDDSKVRVKQPFTGSIDETQHDVNKRTVGIYSFGVAANGSAVGGTDDTAKVQAALDWCASTNQTLDLQSAKLFIAGTLTYQFKKHSIIGNNATIFVAEGSSNVFNLVGHTAPGTAVSDSSAYTFSGFSLYPGVVAVVRTGRTGFFVGSGTLDCGGLASDTISLSGFAIGLTFGSNSFIHNFVKWKFTRCTRCVAYPTGLANSGENINFSHCVFANSDTGIDAGGDCVINVSDSSFDYTPEKIYAHAGGIVKADRCWFEGSDDDAVWIHTLNQLSTVVLNTCTFVVAGPRTKYLFDGATPQGGVILRDPMITTTGNPSYSNPTWGTNNTVVVGTPLYRRPDVSNDTIPFASGMNDIVSPNFELTFTDSSRSDFSLRPASAGTTSRNETVSASAGVTYNPASGYLLMQPPTGNIARITRTLLASPGVTVTAGAFIKSTFSNSTDQLDLNLYFKNATGVTIAVYNKRFNSVTFNAIAARANVLRGIAAPQGTAFIMFEITTTNPALDGSSVHQISHFSIEAGNGATNIQYDTTQSPATGFIPYVYGATSAGAGTYTVQQGGYTVVGNIVFINLTVTWTGHTGTGQMKIGALPYLTDFPAGEIMNVMSSGVTTTGALLGVMDTYSNSMIINQQGPTGALTSLQMAAAGTLNITGVYRRC